MPFSAMKREAYLREHIYMDMCHVYNYAGYFNTIMVSFDANDEIEALDIMRCQSGNYQN